MKPEQKQAARFVVRKVFNHFGTHGFRVDPRGQHWQPLKDAEKLGLAWWPAEDRCALTDAGVRAAAEYSGNGGGA